MEVKSINNFSITFKARLGKDNYKGYKTISNYNGTQPDKFILSKIQNKDNLQKLTVWDFGSGEGRNTIPIAKLGCQVTAFEINEAANKQLKESIFKSNLHNIKVLDTNLLDEIKMNKKPDFIIMSHISQHLNLKDLEKVFQNVFNNIKAGGEFIFDALIRKDPKYKEYDFDDVISKKFGYTMETYGAQSFSKKDIIKLANENGLNLVKTAAYKEKGLGRAGYEHQSLWGGFRVGDYLNGISRKPVKLRWFIFKK